MRILFTVYIEHDSVSGPAANAFRLLPELRRRGHQVIALIFHYGERAPDVGKLTASGVECIVFRRPPYSEDMVRLILKTAAQVLPDIFIPNSSVQGFYASRWIRAAGIPTIAVIRSDDRFHWGVVHEFVDGPREWALSGLVCVNEYLKRRIEPLNRWSASLATIPSGVPIPPKACDRSGPLKIAFAGRFEQEQKRIRDVASSIAGALTLLPDATATFYGHGSQYQYLVDFIESKDLSARMKPAAPVPADEIQDRLLEHNVLVLLSDYEGTPGAVMDAMACGLVPVCLDIPGGVRELVIHEKTGLLVKDREEDFFKAMTRLARNSDLRRELGEAARRHIVDHFSLQSATDKWEQFLKKLIEQSGARRALRVPLPLTLPPVNPDLAREDCRRSMISSALSPLLPAAAKLLRFIAGDGMANRDKFLEPKLTSDFLDLYHIRKSIRDSLIENLPSFYGTVLDIGCGTMPYKNIILARHDRVERYIGMDLGNRPGTTPDVVWDGITIPMDNHSVDCAIATEVLEHCPDIDRFLGETYRVLKPGGLFFFTIPFLWPMHEVPHDEHRYTPFSIERRLREAGFPQIRLKAFGGWDASLAQLLGLWARRRPMRYPLRLLLSLFLRPLCAVLFHLDNPPSLFQEDTMITGLSGTARKPKP
jgi:glycosyltransferase involved in cell wall biosynthesis/SAM-dependent methyltransferase